MKLVKNFVFAVLLASVIAVSTAAGELDTPGFTGNPAPSPTPQRAMSISDEETAINYGDPNASGDTAETSDYLFYEALVALLSLY